MINVIDFLMNYWYVVGVVVLVAAYFLIRHYAKGKAKDVAMKYLEMAEKMVFENADAKLAYVSEAAYNVLPARIRMFVSRGLFSLLVVQVYDSIKDLVQAKNDANGDNQPTTNNSKPT